jgi:hypothetical protein
MQETEIVQENVVQFPVAIIARFLGSYYFIGKVVLDPTLFGFSSARERQWIKCRRKLKILEQISPSNNFCMRFRRALMTTWKDYIVMHWFKDGVAVGELQELLTWMQGRRESNAKKSGVFDTLNEPDCFWNALTSMECESISDAAKRWPDQAYQANQTPGSGRGMHSQHWWLHTLIHNFGLIWIPLVPRDIPQWLTNVVQLDCVTARPMTSTEALISQGFHVMPAASLGLPPDRIPRMCCFNIPRAARCYRQVIQYARVQ